MIIWNAAAINNEVLIKIFILASTLIFGTYPIGEQSRIWQSCELSPISEPPNLSLKSGMRKFRIDQDFLIKHWHMIYIMSVVFADIYFWMKLNSILDIN